MVKDSEESVRHFRSIARQTLTMGNEHRPQVMAEVRRYCEALPRDQPGSQVKNRADTLTRRGKLNAVQQILHKLISRHFRLQVYRKCLFPHDHDV